MSANGEKVDKRPLTYAARPELLTKHSVDAYRPWVDELPFMTPKVIGLFVGGGWAFGMVENDQGRFTVESYIRYKDASLGDIIAVEREIVVEYEPNKHRTEIVTTDEFKIGVDIEPYASLLSIDQLAVTHDRNLALVKRRELLKEISSKRGNIEQTTIHRELALGVNSIGSEYGGPEDMSEARKEEFTTSGRDIIGALMAWTVVGGQYIYVESPKGLTGAGYMIKYDQYNQLVAALEPCLVGCY